MSGKSMEQRLFEAYKRFEGVRLSRDDVQELVGRDDAIRTRISNAAASEAGVEETGHDEIKHLVRTWREFKEYLKANP